MKIKLDSVPPRNLKQISELNSRITLLIDQRNVFLSKAESEQTDNEKNQVTVTEWDDEIRKLHNELEFAEGISYYDRLGLRSTYGKIPVLAIPDSRFINKSASSTSSVNDERAARLLENGAYHFIFDIPFESAIQNFLNIISDIYRDDGKKFSDEVFLLISRVFKRLTGQEFEWRRIERNEVGSGNIILVRSEGTTVDLPIQKVSQGTLSVISMMGLLYHYLSLRYPDVPRNLLTRQHAIVFIDEIDAHLHPNWQQKMTSLLRTEFPNIQFMITAHSPLIITGCKEEEVSVLRKTGDNHFSIHTVMTELIGKPIADIYRIIFEIEEKDEMYLKIVALLPFKKAIEEKATEHRKKKRTPAEDQQLEEMEQQMENFIYIEQFESMRTSQEEKNMLTREKQELLKENTLLKAELNTLRGPLNTLSPNKKS
jgi:hypothetical protein